MPRQNQITVLRQIYLVLTKNGYYYDKKWPELLYET